jgi:c-di-GMP-binding flagellar brake protein YcgR
MESPEHRKEWHRIAGNSETLLRSRIEIAGLLQSIVDGGVLLVSDQELIEHLFIAKLHAVCPEQQFIAVGFSNNRKANAQICAAPSVIFGASHPLGHVSFTASHPSVHYDPLPAIRFAFPELVYVAQRRAHKRIRVAPAVALRCLADEGGFASFEASIVDIGLSGVGVMVHDAAITLAPGTILRGSRIELPDGKVVAVDLEVMHSASCQLPDGRVAQRTGCRFVGDPAAIDPLLKVYVLDLERHDSDS